MKRVAAAACVLALMLTLTSLSLASPDWPSKFRIKGGTTLIDLTPMLPPSYPPHAVLQSEGSVIQHIQGTFFMDEMAIPDPTLSNFFNIGDLTIATKNGDQLVLDFSGNSDAHAVQGSFIVSQATGSYAGLLGSQGAYTGTADECDLGCVPLVDPSCPLVFPSPDCSGFYVDFVFAAEQ